MENNPMRTTPPIGKKSRGFTLIEVLVAVVVLSIGLLGLAALQARSHKFSHDSYLRTQATLLTYDIMERMRTVGSDNADDYTTTTPASTCGSSAATIANDLKCWNDELSARLPSGTGTITQSTTNSDLYTIAVSWSDRETNTTKQQNWVIQVD